MRRLTSGKPDGLAFSGSLQATSRSTTVGTINQFGTYTPPTTAGTYTVVATSQLDPTRTATATVIVPITLDLAPAQARVKPGETVQFAVKNVTGTTNTAVTWSVMQSGGGTVSTTGMYTAPAMTGSYTVVATSVADTRYMASATVTVSTQGDIEITIDPKEATLAKGGTKTFTASIDGQPSTAVTWSCDAGTINASGNYTAPNTFGTFTVKATSTVDSSAYAVASVIVSATSGTEQNFTYDANGNMISDGTRTMEYDEENRLASVTIGSHRTEYVYDGLGRRVQILEKEIQTDLTETTSSDRKFLWVGTSIAEERSGDDGGTVVKQFFAQGFIDSDGTILLYTRDHLGSIRELVDMNQTVRARYDYDPFGNVTKVSGDRDSVFLYTGHFWDARNGIYLTLFRAYDPVLGRWLSRDPLAEGGGVNLYGYVGNNPISLIDPLGLEPPPWTSSFSTDHVTITSNVIYQVFGTSNATPSTSVGDNRIRDRVDLRATVIDGQVALSNGDGSYSSNIDSWSLNIHQDVVLTWLRFSDIGDIPEHERSHVRTSYLFALNLEKILGELKCLNDKLGNIKDPRAREAQAKNYADWANRMISDAIKDWLNMNRNLHDIQIVTVNLTVPIGGW